MSYGTHVLSYGVPLDLRLPWVMPAARVMGQGLMWLGGGVLFAATVYVMVALPGFID